MKKEIVYQLKDNEGKEVLYINGDLINKISLKKGIVFIKSGGFYYSCHPNIHKSGSVKGMIKLGHWKRTDKIIRRGEYKYNVSKIVLSSCSDLICNLIEEGKIEPDFFKRNATKEPQVINLLKIK